MVSVVLLGAGASYGSEKASDRKPPLGDKLFDHLEKRGGIAAQVPDELKAVFKRNFEEGMARFYEYADGDIMRFQRELSHFLAEFEPTDASEYLRLIKALGSTRVIYSSLNYDLLFELSAAKLKLNTFYGTDRQNGHIRLIKLHGSANFWPDIPVGMIRGCTFKRSGRADIQAPIRPLTREATVYRCTNEDSVAPAIAMYAAGKAVKISPDYVEEQQRQWITAVLTAKKVFVVGVRVHSVDEHIWGTLAKTKANLTYFGFPLDGLAFAEWRQGVGKRNAYFVESDFAGCINVIKSRL